MAVYDFNDGQVPSQIIENYNGTPFIRDSRLSVASDVASGGEALAIFQSSADGTFSMDCRFLEFQGDADSYANVGIVFRFVDEDNRLELINRHADNRVRLRKVEGGASTLLISETVAGYAEADIRNLKVVATGQLIEIFLDDVKVGEVNETFNQTATKAGTRIDSEEYSADNLTIPDATGAQKTITFSIPSGAQNASDMLYWVSPISGGDSLLSGTLDTSSASVTLGLDSVTGVTTGQELFIVATNEGALSGSGVVMWDKALVVESGA